MYCIRDLKPGSGKVESLHELVGILLVVAPLRVFIVFVVRLLVRRSEFLGRFLHRNDLRAFPVLVPPILESERDASQSNSDENHYENAPDVLDAYSVRLVVLGLAFYGLGVAAPPFLFQTLQLPSVEQLQDTKNSSGYR